MANARLVVTTKELFIKGVIKDFAVEKARTVIVLVLYTMVNLAHSKIC
jgi:hypothetical protein